MHMMEVTEAMMTRITRACGSVTRSGDARFRAQRPQVKLSATSLSAEETGGKDIVTTETAREWGIGKRWVLWFWLFVSGITESAA